MKRRLSIPAAALLVSFGLPSDSGACAITVHHAAVYAAHPAARSAALYMDISNSCDRIDRLVSVTSEAAKTVVLHATEETSAGVAAMKQIEGGIELPAYGETVRLSPGGYHVMLMGLTEHPSETERMSFTLHFESGTELQVLAGLTFEPHRPAPINPGGNGD